MPRTPPAGSSRGSAASRALAASSSSSSRTGRGGLAAARALFGAAYLDRHDARREPERLQPAGGPPRDRSRDLRERLRVAAPVPDRRLLLHEGGRCRHRDRLLVLAARRSAQPFGRRAGQGGERLLVDARDLPERRQAGALEARLQERRQLELGDWFAREKRQLVAGQHDQQPAGPRPGRGDAGGEARGGDAERGVEAQAPLQLVADRLGRADWRAVAGSVRASGRRTPRRPRVARPCGWRPAARPSPLR